MSENLIALYPILGVTGHCLDDPFDLGQLPATIVPGVTVEDGKAFFNSGSFDLWGGYVSKRERESLERVRFAMFADMTMIMAVPITKQTKAPRRPFG